MEILHDQMCAGQLRQELDVKDRPMSMETMLNRLEDFQKLIESLDINHQRKAKQEQQIQRRKSNSYMQIRLYNNNQGRLYNNNQGVQLADWNMT